MSASRSYTRAFKARMVRKMLGPDAVSASQLAEETGICQPTLSRWLRDERLVPRTPPKLAVVSSSDDEASKGAAAPRRRPVDWSLEDKLRALVEALELDEAELGAFLRRRGLHGSDLKAWRAAVADALEKPKARSRTTFDTKRIRSLERELQRKEKALAEAAALLVLKKRLESYFGSADEDESTTSRPER